MVDRRTTSRREGVIMRETDFERERGKGGVKI